MRRCNFYCAINFSADAEIFVRYSFSDDITFPLSGGRNRHSICVKESVYRVGADSERVKRQYCRQRIC